MGCGASASKAYTVNVTSPEGKVENAGGAEAWAEKSFPEKKVQHEVSFNGSRAFDLDSENLPDVQFVQAITRSDTELGTYVNIVIDEVLRILEGDRCSIFFVNEIRHETWCVGAKGINPFCMSLSHGIVGAVAREGELLNLRDAHDHPAFDNTVEKRTGYRCRSLICLPLTKTREEHGTSTSKAIGVIQVLNKKGSDEAVFSEADARAFQRLGDVISDSFYRQRWRALESGAAFEDDQVQALLDCHQDTRKRQTVTRQVSGAPDSPISPAGAWNTNLSAEAPLEFAANTGSDLVTLEYGVLAKDPASLASRVAAMMHDSGCVERCGISRKTLSNWTEAVRLGYHGNPFHNFLHGFAVMQMTFYQLRQADIFGRLSTLEVFGLLLASLCHDIDHRGRTNSFLIDSEDELAILYNDRSVLENHHASTAWKLLKSRETDIARGLPSDSRRQLRKVVTSCILSTDMAQHSAMCSQLAGYQTPGQFEQACSDNTQLLLHVCIHASDLSGQVLPWKDACQWEQRVSQEFVNQAREERALGRTPLPFMDFNIEDLKLRGKLQRDFIDFVLTPLWEPYTTLLPALHPCWENLSANRSKYEARRLNGNDGEELIPERSDS
eukprot:gb/GFBE01077520.1/.p1 GENE.gb/GFBE01077520.1/~~gb/GFBE01077520.1/.p1  ORF type:complete len:611 (+),score=92.82 gb/GFBE01077520.1/:1-1833(+)